MPLIEGPMLVAPLRNSGGEALCMPLRWDSPEVIEGDTTGTGMLLVPELARLGICVLEVQCELVNSAPDPDGDSVIGCETVLLALGVPGRSPSAPDPDGDSVIGCETVLLALGVPAGRSPGTPDPDGDSVKSGVLL